MKIPEGLAAKIRNSSKFTWSCFSNDCEIFNIKMVKAVGTETIILAMMASPPLSNREEEDIERILKEAREYYRKKGLITDEEWETYKKVLR